MKKFLSPLLLLFFSTGLPLILLAEGSPGGVEGSGGGLINNPISSINSIPDLIAAILKGIITIGMPVLAIALIYVGFLFVEARGNPSKLEEAKKAFLWTIIGAAIILGAVVIRTAIQATITSLK